MIGNHHHRAKPGDAGQASGIILDVDRQPAHGGGKKAFAGRGVAAVVEIDAFQFALAGRPLDQVNQMPLDRAVAGIGIGKDRIVHVSLIYPEDDAFETLA